MIEDFVAERGGGLLISGMVDEEFIGTPIADILPITLVEENFLTPICAEVFVAATIQPENCSFHG